MDLVFEGATGRELDGWVATSEAGARRSNGSAGELELGSGANDSLPDWFVCPTGLIEGFSSVDGVAVVAGVHRRATPGPDAGVSPRAGPPPIPGRPIPPLDGGADSASEPMAWGVLVSFGPVCELPSMLASELGRAAEVDASGLLTGSSSAADETADRAEDDENDAKVGAERTETILVSC